MFLLRSQFLVACLCSVIHMFRFLLSVGKMLACEQALLCDVTRELDNQLYDNCMRELDNQLYDIERCHERACSQARKMHLSLSFFSQTFSICFHNCINCSFHFDDLSNIIHDLTNLPVW